MKKEYSLYLLPFLIVCLLFFSGSCAKEQAKSNHPQLDPAQFEQIGIEHNKALGTVYHALYAYKHQPSNLKPMEYTLQGALDVSETTVLGYLEENQEFSEESQQLAVGLVQNIYDHEPVAENNNLYTAATAAGLTPPLLQALDALNVVLSDEDHSLSSLQARISQIEATVPALNLTIEEQGLIYSAAAVGRHTLEYWNVNYENWLALNGGTGSKTGKVFSWKQAGKHDVAGAVAGAVTTGVLRLFGPVGWSVWGAAILGGAAGASAYDAIIQLW